ncbi:MAG: RraA family protein [Thermomicrobiales bacterium]
MNDAPDNATLRAAFAQLSTALIADACLRVGAEVRALPQTLRPLASASPFAGRALPMRHAGSVDIFLEALTDAQPGDVAAIDNGALTDEACIGDLVALEMRAAGITGAIIWGCHRDTAELAAIGLPIVSLGSCPAGPPGVRDRADDALLCARFGDVAVRRDDFLFADDDGVVVVGGAVVGMVLAAARRIADTERAQAAVLHAGTTLRAQLDFASYLARRAADPSYTFRVHLRGIGGAIEE